MFERDLVAKGCNTYKHCVIAIVVRIWILNLSCLRSERMSGDEALTRLGCSEFDDVAGDAYPLVFDADAVHRRVVERADELFQVISRYEEYVP